MADETEINDNFFDAEASEDESTPKIRVLNQRISDLQHENDRLIHENVEYQKRIVDLKANMKELNAENMDFDKRLDQKQSENKAAAAVLARSKELENEVSRLQRDLVTTVSDLQISNAEITGLKRDLESMTRRENEMGLNLDAVEKEKAVLMTEVEKLERAESSVRVEMLSKEREIQVLKNDLEELEVVVGNSKSLENSKNELQMKIVIMKAEITKLESNLDEKEKMISGLETKERAIRDVVNDIINDDSVSEGVKKDLVGGANKWNWLVAGGSTMAAVAALCVACYVHTARRR